MFCGGTIGVGDVVAGVLKRFKRPVRGCCMGRCGSAECVLCVSALEVRRRGTVMFGERGRFFSGCLECFQSKMSQEE